MNFSDIVTSIGAFGPTMPGMAEYAAEQQRIVERALLLREHRPVSAEDARIIARFSLNTWAQRFPVQAYDLGQDAALFIADWLSARAVGPTEDNLHEALKAWRVREALGSLASQAKIGAAEVRSIAPLFRDLGRSSERAARHRLRPPTRGYWAKRCRCRACRDRWQTGQVVDKLAG